MEQIKAMLNHLISKYTFVVDDEREQLKNDIIKGIEKLEKENQELKEKSVKAVGFVKLLIDNISNEKLNDDRCSITNIKTGEEYGNLKEYITKMFNIIWDIEIKWLD